MYEPRDGDRVLISRIGTLHKFPRTKEWTHVSDSGDEWTLDETEFDEPRFFMFYRLPPLLPTTAGSVVRHDLEFAKGILAVLDDEGFWVDAYARRKMLLVTEIVHDAGKP